MNRVKLVILGLITVLAAAGTVFGVDEFGDETVVSDDEDAGSVEDYDLLRTATEYGTLSTFVTMLQKSDLVEQLRGEGPFTVFIPDDSAFRTLDTEWLKQTLADPKQVEKLLARHIVTDAAVTFGREEVFKIASLGGDSLRITADAEKVTVDNAEVLDEEIECSNGIIHVIDAVLVNP